MPPKRQFTGKFAKKPFVKRSYNNNDDDNDGPSKRFKSSTTASTSGSAVSKPPDGARHVDEEGNFYWELGGNSRRVTVSEFRGNVLVSVREYYDKDGKYFPGKKGISMTLEQFNQLIRVLPALEEAIGQKTSTGVVRPIYTTSAKHDAPKVKSKPEIDSEDDEELEVENKSTNVKDEQDEDEDEDEQGDKTSDAEQKPPKKAAGKTKPKEEKKPKSKKKKVPDSEDEDDDDDNFVEDDSEEEYEVVEHQF